MTRVHTPRRWPWSIVAKTFRKTLRSNPDIDTNLKWVWLPKFIPHGARRAVSPPAQRTVAATAAANGYETGRCRPGKEEPPVPVPALRPPPFPLGAAEAGLGARRVLALWGSSTLISCCTLFLSPPTDQPQRYIRAAASLSHALHTQTPGT